MSTNQRFSNRNHKTRRIGWFSATQNVPFPSAASRKCRKNRFAFAIQSFVDCAHYFINLMKHFMHCWKYFSYIFSILLSSWFMLSSSAFYIGLLWLSLHAQNLEQDHKTYRRFLVLCCIALHTTKTESGRRRVVVIACPIHQLRNGANSLCVSIGGAFNVSEKSRRAHRERETRKAEKQAAR